MKSLIESSLENDHESLGQLLAELDTELNKSNFGRSFELLDFFWARLAVHIRAENLHLFPALDNVSPSLFNGEGGLPSAEEAHELLLRLRSDHDFFMKELATAIKILREMADDPPTRLQELKAVRRRLNQIEKRLKVHNQLEEEQAYKWPALLFDKNTIAKLQRGLKHELENLPPRFANVGSH